MIKQLWSAVVVAVAAVLITACGHASNPGTETTSMTSGVPVDPALTEASARQQTITYLTDTLRRLPANISLSWQHPEFPQTVFGDATVAPCIDDDTVPNRPYNVGANYWVIGVPAGKSHEYVDSFVKAWEQLGWKPVRDDHDPQMPQVRAGTPDGYLLTLTQNPRGDLAVSMSSPCFPQDKKGGQPIPQTIAHP
ncbi:hypothetical protein IU500_24755 [Nocardia terpenica]|uniref:hypothetical protein n=1 Tax=Nocardia terpenica TaxID=455432 RepID=UPI0018958D79|nr:hypothetical protein [Nocardia terpenica]MBF6064713.1 hypothetical protein [Nocardia terpenica]MBF6107228.1 hypothetical protein [Nocardia terpenica]MBF6114985.1 hypothetical protein [Nocardia terpenica]MBF6122091.1 hypothetical protein [Nocardia terpenica]MBF6154474.1 hypothetical protein [Nocardia terpenica]